MTLCQRYQCRHRETPGAALTATSRPAGPSPYKGMPLRLIDEANAEKISDLALDTQNFNAVSLEVYCSGAGASAVVTVLGGPSDGRCTLPVTDPNSGQTVTSNRMIDVIVGSARAKVRVSSVTGTWTVIATPYIAPGPTSLVASVN